jgi:hypothetical protein
MSRLVRLFFLDLTRTLDVYHLFFLERPQIFILSTVLSRI